MAGAEDATYRLGVVSGPPRRSPKPPPPPKKPRPSSQTAFDPSKPLLDLDGPAAPAKPVKRRLEPVLPNLDLPSRKSKAPAPGLGPVAMSDPLQDAATLVSTPNPLVAQSDEPLAGGTEVASPPIPRATPKPTSIIPGDRNAVRSNLPFIALGTVAAVTWVGALVLGAVQDPKPLPDMGTAAATTDPAPRPKKAAKPKPTANPAPVVEAVAPEPAAPSGWSVQADAAPRTLQLAGTTAVASFAGSIVGYRDGAAAWTFEGKHHATYAQGDTVAVVQSASVVGLSAVDGSQQFSVDLPKKGKSAPEVVASDANGEQVLIALADARFLVVTPGSCAEDNSAATDDAVSCVRTVGRLSGEYLEPSSQVALGAAGHRYLAEEDAVRGFDVEMRTVFEASLHADVRSMRAAPGGRLALQFGQETALLDTERCRGRSEVRLRTSDIQAPAGCVQWRYGRAVDPVPPAVLDTDAVALNERGKLQVVTEGDDAWKIPLGTFGPVAKGEGSVFTLAVDGDNLIVAEVDASSSEVKARHPLAFNATPEDRGAAHLHANAGAVAVAVGTNIAVVPL